MRQTHLPAYQPVTDNQSTPTYQSDVRAMRERRRQLARQHPLDRQLADLLGKAISSGWCYKNATFTLLGEACAELAMETIARHLSRCADETLHPRLAEAVEAFLAFEYPEGDRDAECECAPEDLPGYLPDDGAAAEPVETIPGQLSLFDLVDMQHGAEPSITDTIVANVKHHADGRIEYSGIRHLNGGAA